MQRNFMRNTFNLYVGPVLLPRKLLGRAHELTRNQARLKGDFTLS